MLNWGWGVVSLGLQNTFEVSDFPIKMHEPSGCPSPCGLRVSAPPTLCCSDPSGRWAGGWRLRQLLEGPESALISALESDRVPWCRGTELTWRSTAGSVCRRPRALVWTGRWVCSCQRDQNGVGRKGRNKWNNIFTNSLIIQVWILHIFHVYPHLFPTATLGHSCYHNLADE